MRADIASADPTLCRPPCSPAAISLCNKLPLAAITQPDLGDLVAKGLFDNDPEITDTTAAILQHISFPGMEPDAYYHSVASAIGNRPAR